MICAQNCKKGHNSKILEVGSRVVASKYIGGAGPNLDTTKPRFHSALVTDLFKEKVTICRRGRECPGAPLATSLINVKLAIINPKWRIEKVYKIFCRWSEW